MNDLSNERKKEMPERRSRAKPLSRPPSRQQEAITQVRQKALADHMRKAKKADADHLNKDLKNMIQTDFSKIPPVTSEDKNAKDLIAARERPSRLHVEDILTQPMKVTFYTSYHVSTHETYENKGIQVTAAAYVPLCKETANLALRSLARGSSRRYFSSEAFEEIKRTLIFDDEAAESKVRILLLKYGISDSGEVEKCLDILHDREFLPGRDMERFYQTMHLKDRINPKTGDTYKPKEIARLRHELTSVINEYTPDIKGIQPVTFMSFHDLSDLEKQKRMLDNYFSEHLLAGTKSRGVGNLAGSVSAGQLKKLLKRSDLTAEEAALLKHAINLHAAIKVSEISHQELGIVRSIQRSARKHLMQSHMGAGAFLAWDVSRMISRTLKYTLKNAAQTGKGAKYGLKIALRPVRTLGINVNKTLRVNPEINQVLVQYADPVMNRMRNTVTSASRTFDRMQQGHNLLRKKKYAVKSKTIRFFRDPFRLRETVKNSLVKTKIWKRASKKIAPVRNATTFIQHILAKAVAGTSAAIQTILSLLSGILIVFLLLLLLFVVFYFLITTFMNMFTLNADAGDTDTAILNQCIDTINQMYENQMDEIDRITTGKQYRNVTVNFRQVKDEEAYTENDTEEEGSTIYAYTNSREILSLTKVYFDFDLEGADPDEVLDYVRKLYNGSHTYYLTETPVYDTDADGNLYVSAYDATIDYTTYYLNSIFNCQLANDSYGGSAILGSDLTGSVAAQQIWNYCKSAGWSDAACAALLGNAAQESGGTLISGINPSAHGSGGRGILGFTYSPDSKRSDDGMGLVRYADSQGTAWTDLKTQLDYFILCQKGIWGSMWSSDSQTAKEFRRAGYTVPSCSFEQFLQLQDVDQATMVFLCAYENCGIKNARWETRSREANKAYRLYAQSAGSQEQEVS